MDQQITRKFFIHLIFLPDLKGFKKYSATKTKKKPHYFIVINYFTKITVICKMTFWLTVG